MKQYKGCLERFPANVLGTWVGGHLWVIETNETDFMGVSHHVSFDHA